MKLKKVLITVGTITTALAPVAAALSCGKKDGE